MMSRFADGLNGARMDWSADWFEYVSTAVGPVEWFLTRLLVS